MRQDLPTRALWLAIVIVFALGAAGLVTAMTHRPGTDTREELTWRADQAIKPELEAAFGDLQRIATDLEELGRQGRIALGALTSGDVAGLDEAMDEGQLMVDRIADAVAGVRSRTHDAGRLGADPGALRRRRRRSSSGTTSTSPSMPPTASAPRGWRCARAARTASG